MKWYHVIDRDTREEMCIRDSLYGAYDTYAKMGRYKQEWQGRPIFPEVIYDG